VKEPGHDRQAPPWHDEWPTGNRLKQISRPDLLAQQPIAANALEVRPRSRDRPELVPIWICWYQPGLDEEILVSH